MDAPAAFRLCFKFRKFATARYLSALDLTGALEASLRRARLPVAYSGGFHPRPRLHFEDALPLGWSSECESCWIEFVAPYPAREAMRRLAGCLPEGLELLECFVSPAKPQPSKFKRFRVNGCVANIAVNELPEGVSCSVETEGSLLFELDARETTKVPSMKKVLKEICPELVNQLDVCRLAVEK